MQMIENIEEWEEITQKIDVYCKKTLENIPSWNDLITIKKEFEETQAVYEKQCIEETNLNEQIEHYQIEIEGVKKNFINGENTLKNATIILEELRLEKNSLQEKLKVKHKALKQANKFYKLQLDINLVIEKIYNEVNEIQEMHVTVFFFKTSCNDAYSATLIYNLTEDKWILSKTTPNLETVQCELLQKRFYETQNLSVLLCTLRNIFKIYKNDK